MHVPDTLCAETASESDGAALAASAGLDLRRAQEAWDDDRFTEAEAILAPHAGDPQVDVALRMIRARIALSDRASEPAALGELVLIAGDWTVPTDIREAAGTFASRVTEPRRRDELTILSHVGGAWAVRSGVSVGEGRTGFAAEVPFGATWRGRAELNVTPFPTQQVQLWGYRFFLGPALSWPLGQSRFALEASAGVGVWDAQGPWWKSGSAFQVGVRGLGAVDWRFGRNVGMALEVGTTWWPTLSADLEGFGEPLDIRLSVKAWFGVPPVMKLVARQGPTG